MAASSEDKGKQRIVDHMNRDHQRELSHYLRHFCQASSSAARNPSIRDLTFTTLTIDARGKDYTVPITPPLTSWADARSRFVEMDVTARTALGISDVRLDTYQKPRKFESLIFGAVVFYYLCAATLPWVVPGTKIWGLVDGYFPGGVSGYAWLVRKIFWPVTAIHLTEAVLLDVKRMQPYSVERFSALWWKWEISCLIEGFGAFARSKAIVDRKRAEKEAKNH